MSYGIMRVQKMTKGSVRGIQLHDQRTKDVSHTNHDIDYARTNLNYDLHNSNDIDFNKAVADRINSLKLTKTVRKDAIVMAQCLVTSDKPFFDKMTPEQTQKFFKDSYEFVKERYGAENIISAVVHMDEATPHMHVNFVPVTEDGRLSAKTILNRMDLIKSHDDFFKVIGKPYGLERGERSDDWKEHLSVAEFKKQTHQAELKNLDDKINALKDVLKPLEADFSLVDKLQNLKTYSVDSGALKACDAKIFDEMKSGAINELKLQIKLMDAEIKINKNSELQLENDVIKAENSKLKEIKNKTSILNVRLKEYFDIYPEALAAYRELFKKELELDKLQRELEQKKKKSDELGKLITAGETKHIPEFNTLERQKASLLDEIKKAKQEVENQTEKVSNLQEPKLSAPESAPERE